MAIFFYITPKLDYWQFLEGYLQCRIENHVSELLGLDSIDSVGPFYTWNWSLTNTYFLKIISDIYHLEIIGLLNYSYILNMDKFYCVGLCSVSKSCMTLWDHMDCNTPVFPVFTVSWNLLKFMSNESVMLSNHLILCRPFLFLLSIFPSVWVFSNELALQILLYNIK